MGQVLKAGGDKTHLGSQANKLLSKSATFFYTKSCIPVRVVLQPSPPSPHCPPPQKPSDLCSFKSSNSPSLFKFHFPQQSNYFSHQLLQW